MREPQRDEWMERSAEVGRGAEGGISPDRGAEPQGGTQHQHGHGGETRHMWPDQKTGVQRPLLPQLQTIPGPRAPGAARPGLAHLLAQLSTYNHSPGSGFNLLRRWGGCRASGRPPGLPSACGSQSRAQQKWPSDPASQPLGSPGPHRARELPGKDPARVLRCLVSI